MYKQPLIAKIIALQWFGNKKAVGICYPQYFNPLTVQLLAFVLTACAIREWETSEHRVVAFQGVKYGNVYKQHVQNLENWRQYNEATGDNTLERVL
ncbi:hypothetical protein SCLCIDRAFT_138879 [Scleroderma citrinum Foug A]|uniref:DUF6532 domain-containing protein n=1 Tax=Scleroderma citrinum Foug A TaxID=1036808 RepID=A0A0C3DB00_9AGAM|nr:hypothetical protein SCLCIDRAFT_138879 [Scleroderma citrinum Foug A]